MKHNIKSPLLGIDSNIKFIYDYIVFGVKYHFKNNSKLHRVDGPAVEYPDGTGLYFIDDKEYTEEEYNRVIKLLTFI